jgi:hypothetical protein
LLVAAALVGTVVAAAALAVLGLQMDLVLLQALNIRLLSEQGVRAEVLVLMELQAVILFFLVLLQMAVGLVQ